MYFYKKQGRQVLDLRGNLILSHNPQLIRARVKSAGPRFAKNGKYILSSGFFSKLRATRAALSFIWGPSQALTAGTIDQEGL